MRERRIWNFSTNDVVRVTIRQQGRVRQIVRNGPHDWSLAPGSQGIINDLAVEETVSGLCQLGRRGVDRARRPEPSPLRLQRSGLPGYARTQERRKACPGIRARSPRPISPVPPSPWTSSSGSSSSPRGYTITWRDTFLFRLTLEISAPNGDAPETQLLADLPALFSPVPHHRLASGARLARRAPLPQPNRSA